MTQDRSRPTPRRALSFGADAEAYDRGRPGYPREAAAWLTAGPGDDQPLTVLEIGAGTGKLTAELVALGHDVHATDPDPAMLELLGQRVPGARTSVCRAEELPAATGGYDVVVAAQCYHWFDPERALPEVARVLKPGGHLAVTWNQRDERVPWVRRLGAIIGTQAPGDPTESVEASELFADVERLELKQRQRLDRRTVLDLGRSRSNVAVLDPAARERVLADLLALYDDYGRGMDGMALPYLTHCFRARVLPRPVVEETASGAPADWAADDPEATMPFNLVDTADTIPRVAAGLGPSFGGSAGVGHEDGIVLIDFR